MSHVSALANAAGRTDDATGGLTYEFVNLRNEPALYDKREKKLLLANRQWSRPDMVCLALEGNLHNVFSLQQTKRTFSLGDAALGSVPPPDSTVASQDSVNPQFVPRDMLKLAFQRKLSHLDGLIVAIAAHFPGARFVHVCAPPPVLSLPPMPSPEDQPPDFNPMIYYLDFGACTPALRLKIYQIQTEIFVELAARHGATFLHPPVQSLSPEGFLDTAYWDWDPTHGNARYGRLVLDQIEATVAAELIA